MSPRARPLFSVLEPNFFFFHRKCLGSSISGAAIPSHFLPSKYLTMAMWLLSTLPSSDPLQIPECQGGTPSGL